MINNGKSNYFQYITGKKLKAISWQIMCFTNLNHGIINIKEKYHGILQPAVCANKMECGVCVQSDHFRTH